VVNISSQWVHLGNESNKELEHVERVVVVLAHDNAIATLVLHAHCYCSHAPGSVFETMRQCLGVRNAVSADDTRGAVASVDTRVEGFSIRGDRNWVGVDGKRSGVNCRGEDGEWHKCGVKMVAMMTFISHLPVLSNHLHVILSSCAFCRGQSCRTAHELKGETGVTNG
jgi:hypothetical protein